MMAEEVKRKGRDIQKPAGCHVMRLGQEKTPTDLISTKYLRFAIDIEDQCHHIMGVGGGRQP